MGPNGSSSMSCKIHVSLGLPETLTVAHASGCHPGCLQPSTVSSEAKCSSAARGRCVAEADTLVLENCDATGLHSSTPRHSDWASTVHKAIRSGGVRFGGGGGGLGIRNPPGLRASRRMELAGLGKMSSFRCEQLDPGTAGRVPA